MKASSINLTNNPYPIGTTLYKTYNKGYNFVESLVSKTIPVIGTVYNCENLGTVECNAKNIRQIHADLVDSEQAKLRLEPSFQKSAKKFNASKIADDFWEAFDLGVDNSIAQDLANYYGDNTVEKTEKPVERFHGFHVPSMTIGHTALDNKQYEIQFRAPHDNFDGTIFISYHGSYISRVTMDELFAMLNIIKTGEVQ
jgi:hypothetical protein